MLFLVYSWCSRKMLENRVKMLPVDLPGRRTHSNIVKEHGEPEFRNSSKTSMVKKSGEYCWCISSNAGDAIRIKLHQRRQDGSADVALNPSC
mmetsp:Transcript_16000/g.65811  ORF Transcript_16000/g.65811 Transcript_16000/m.65811 type:complete len:92 (-) Transcript_16000:3326-3601(-)